MKNDLYKNILLDITEDDFLMKTISKYWENFCENVEEERFSALSKPAFQTIQSICKYQVMKGGIVNEILDENGQVINDKDIVSSNLINALKEVQQSGKSKQYMGTLPFPNFRALAPH